MVSPLVYCRVKGENRFTAPTNKWIVLTSEWTQLDDVMLWQDTADWNIVVVTEETRGHK